MHLLTRDELWTLQEITARRATERLSSVEWQALCRIEEDLLLGSADRAVAKGLRRRRS